MLAYVNKRVLYPAARWKSALVAVKIVEHSHFPKENSGSHASDPTSNEAKIAREMLLSTSISHPNIIATYRICTISVGIVPDAGSLDSNEVCTPVLSTVINRGIHCNLWTRVMLSERYHRNQAMFFR